MTLQSQNLAGDGFGHPIDDPSGVSRLLPKNKADALPANPVYSNAPRDVQTIRCCGVIYKRWKFKTKRNFRHGKRFLHATHCEKCGCVLNWPANFEPQRIAAVRKKERENDYYNRKVEFRLAGKNCLGKPWGRTPTFLTAEERLSARRRRGSKAWNIRVERMKRLGLTTRGTKPKYQRGKTGVAKLWQELRAGIKMPVAINFETVNSGSLKR